MNLIHRSLWNEKTGTFVAVSEHVRSAGKQTMLDTRAKRAVADLVLELLALPLLLLFAPYAYALPAGAVITAGGASINSAAGSSIITQSSQNVAINWQSFNIGQGEAVRFIQPNSSAVALNRVLGADPSSILGSLSANGKIFLVNPNGILFGQGASVNVGGLVASTLDIDVGDFMAGRYKFLGNSSAAVLNQGTIDADGRYVALLGANVGNDGIIQARLGSVTLAAGNAITLDVAGDGLLSVTVNRGAVDALVRNGGMIQADGGQVLLTAQAAGNLLPSAVNTTGLIQAQTIENRAGTIRLLGGENGTVIVGGTLDVSGTGAGKVGGDVTVTGQHVGLLGADINASGDAGGGTVLIGGDYQGKNPAVPNASATYMSADSTITASAITDGNGGKVILWADDATRVYGSISAVGGSQGGNGGLIETSGHWLDVAGIKVNASAPNGARGTWLLDPNNITIQAAGAETNVTASPNFTSTDDTAIVTTATIQTALIAGNNVIVTTGTGGTNAQLGDITVADTITWTNVAGPTLTLNAVHDVIVNVGAAITATTGSLVLNAGNDVTVNAATKTTTGNLTFKAGNNVNLNAATTVVTGDLTSIAGRNVNVAAAISVTTGNVVLHADNGGTGPGAVIGGTVGITCVPSCITITDLAGKLSIRFNPVDYTSTNAEITAYGLKLTGGAALDAKAWVFGAGDNKVYTGTTTATVSGFKPDVLSALPPVALGAVTSPLFDTKHVGTNKLITFGSAFSDPVYDLFIPFGAPAGTYTTRGNITPAPLGIIAADQTKTYGTAFTFLGSEFTPSGLQNAETVGSVTLTSAGAAATAHVAGGPYTITLSAASGGSFTASDYAISYTNAPLGFTVNTAPLGIIAADQTKTYGTAFTFLGSEFTPSGLQNAETVGSVTLTSAGAAATAHVAGGPYTITPSAASGGSFTASDYAISYVNGALLMVPLALTGSITVADKLYDATTVATITGRMLSGVLGTDDLSYTDGIATFDTSATGVGKVVTATGLSLSGADAANYTVNSTAATTATITPVVPSPVVVVLPIEPPPTKQTLTTMPDFAAEEMMGAESVIIQNSTLGITQSLNLRIVRAGLPPQLRSVAPVVDSAPEAPVEMPQTDLPPQRPRKQDRN
jgi:filamentous hemagglutinin family protein